MDLLTQLFFVFICGVVTLYLLLKITLSYWENRGILQDNIKINWGHLKSFDFTVFLVKSIHTHYEKYKGRAPFIGFYVMLKPMLLILDMDCINNILIKDSNYFEERGISYSVKHQCRKENTLKTDGIAWWNLQNENKTLPQTKKFTETCTGGLLKLQQLFEACLSEIQQFEFVYNVSELIENFNIDLISHLSLKLEDNSLRGKDPTLLAMCKDYTEQQNNIFKMYVNLSLPILSNPYKSHVYSPQVANYFQKLINHHLYEQEHLQRLQQQPDGFFKICCDYIKSFIYSQNEKKVNNAEITARAFNFVNAGMESVKTTITCCLYELAMQPEIQEKARSEIYATIRKYKNQLNESAIEEMVYLKQVLYETLRKHTPYPFLLRLTTKDYELPNSIFMFKKGNRLIIPISAIHNDPAYYEHPDKFYPDHFHSSKVQKRPRCAFLPFGLGPRSCGVERFIQQQMLLCLALLLKRYSFSTCKETIIPLTFNDSKLPRKPRYDIKLMLKRLQF